MTVKVNLAYVLPVPAALAAALVALQLPEIKRYIKIETM